MRNFHSILGLLGVLPPLPPPRAVPPPVDPLRVEVESDEIPIRPKVADDYVLHDATSEERNIPDSWYRDLGNSFAAQSGYTNNPGYRGRRTVKRPKSEKRARQLKRRNTKRNKR